jgi:hypothetical protein
MTVIEKLVANGNAILNFLKNFSSDVPQDVSVDWINDDGSIDTKTFANIKKFQDSVGMVNDGGVIKDLGGNIVGTACIPLWSGGNNAHKQSNDTSWHYMNFNYDVHKDPRFDDYVEKINDGQYGFKIKKAGYYRFNGEVLQHCSQAQVTRHTLLERNGSYIHYAHGSRMDAGWGQTIVDGLSWFDVDDILTLRCYIGSTNNNYQWHSTNFYKYTILQLTYMGDR